SGNGCECRRSPPCDLPGDPRQATATTTAIRALLLCVTPTINSQRSRAKLCQQFHSWTTSAIRCWLAWLSLCSFCNGGSRCVGSILGCCTGSCAISCSRFLASPSFVLQRCQFQSQSQFGREIDRSDY